MTLVDEATALGARREQACAVLGVSARSVERWRTEDGGDDQRRGPSELPAHALTAEDRAQALQIADSPEYRDLPAEQMDTGGPDARLLPCRPVPKPVPKPVERAATEGSRAYAGDSGTRNVTNRNHNKTECWQLLT